jgi:hypothetical protein
VRIRVVVICCCLVASVAVVLTRIVDLSLNPDSRPPSVAGASTVDAAVPAPGTGSRAAGGRGDNDDDTDSASPGATDAADAAGGADGATVTGGDNQQEGGNPATGMQPSPTPDPVPITTPPAPNPSFTSPTPPVSRVVSYEAESSRNTLTGTRTFTCLPCSGGRKVGDVGDGTALVFNKVNVTGTGTVTVTIAYLNGDPTERRAQLSVNGGAAQWLTFAPTADWDTVATLTVNLTLRSGDNTIRLSNPWDMAPDFDRLTVREGS